MRLWRLCFVLLFAACAPAPTPTAAPTQTLIPPTATEPRPDPASVAPTPTPEILIPADAQGFVSQAVQDLAAGLDLTPSAVLVGVLEPVAWDDSNGCTPGVGEATTDGYRIVLYADGEAFAYRADSDGVTACDASIAAGATAAPDADPLAAEMALMAQRRLGEALDLSTRRVRVVSIEPMTWTDTSLNCPSPDVTYEPAEVAGYRLVLAAGDEQYIFHADFERLVACPPGQEALPEATEAVN